MDRTKDALAYLLRGSLHDAWRDAEAEHDLLVAQIFHTEPGHFAPRTTLTENDLDAIGRLRSAANEAHAAWLRGLAEELARVRTGAARPDL